MTALRPMTEADLEAVAALDARAFPVEPWPAAMFASELRHTWSRCWVLCDGEGVGDGSAIIGHMVFWQVVDELQLHHVAVDPRCQGQGHGQRLIAALRDHAVAHGCAAIHLEVRASNRPAIDLYRRAGFAVCGRRRRYYQPDGEDALLMTLVPGQVALAGEVRV